MKSNQSKEKTNPTNQRKMKSDKMKSDKRAEMFKLVRSLEKMDTKKYEFKLRKLQLKRDIDSMFCYEKGWKVSQEEVKKKFDVIQETKAEIEEIKEDIMQEEQLLKKIQESDEEEQCQPEKNEEKEKEETTEEKE
jgi:hypothetical protein